MLVMLLFTCADSGVVVGVGDVGDVVVSQHLMRVGSGGGVGMVLVMLMFCVESGGRDLSVDVGGGALVSVSVDVGGALVSVSVDVGGGAFVSVSCRARRLVTSLRDQIAESTDFVSESSEPCDGHAQSKRAYTKTEW